MDSYSMITVVAQQFHEPNLVKGTGMEPLLNFHDYDVWQMEETTINPSVLEKLRSYRMHGEGSSCCYDDSYSMLQIVLQDMGRGAYWAFLRDYGIGYIREFGAGFYIYDEEEYDDDLDFCVIAGADLGKRIDAGEVNLDQEIYDYYHVLPSKADIHMVHSGPVVSVLEAANRLGCSSSRVKKMADDRMIEAYRRGGEVLITEESIEARIAYIRRFGKPTRSTSFATMSRCSTMTAAMTDACYDAAIGAGRDERSIEAAACEVSRATGMNKSSAKMYLNAVQAMLDGGSFDKDINTYSVNRYLDRIYEDFGAEAMPNAYRAINNRNEALKKMGYVYAYYRKAVERSRKIHAGAAEGSLDSNKEFRNPGALPGEGYSGHVSATTFGMRSVSKGLDRVAELENKQFAFACMRLLENAGATTSENLAKLQEPVFCKREFDMQFPILKNVAESEIGEIDRLVRDGDGRQRYYKQVIRLGQGEYVVTNDWYGLGKTKRDTRTPFLSWISLKIGGHSWKEISPWK